MYPNSSSFNSHLHWEVHLMSTPVKWRVPAPSHNDSGVFGLYSWNGL